jgi:membrane protease YdiL (CAAX protease family)
MCQFIEYGVFFHCVFNRVWDNAPEFRGYCMTTNEQQPEGFFAQLGQVYTAPPWTLFEAGLVWVVLLFSLVMIGSGITATLATDSSNPTPTNFLVGWLLGLVITGLFVVVRFRRTPEKFAALRLVGESAQSRRPLLLVFMMGVGIGLTANLVAALGSGGDFETIAPLQAIFQGIIVQLVLAVLFAVLVQPIAEGLVFFGVIEPRLRSSIGAWPGLLTTVLLYTATHYLVYGARPGIVNNLTWYGVIAPLLIGLSLAVIRIWMRSTRAASVASIGAGVVAIVVWVAVVTLRQ